MIELPDPVILDIQPENIPLDILYEDQDILIINKPKDMVVHPAPGHYTGTLVNAVMYHCGEDLSTINGVLRPGIVHRIDKDTTGVLVICKNDRAHRAIAEQLSVHSITRAYYAIVYNNIKEDEGTVDAPIGRMDADRKKMGINHKNGRHAVTHYRVLERFGKYTYIECRLETGRTHQIQHGATYRPSSVRYRLWSFLGSVCWEAWWRFDAKPPDLSIRPPVSMWNLNHRFRHILQHCWTDCGSQPADKDPTVHAVQYVIK